MIDSLLNQLRENRRLRWGVGLIVAIFWLYAILVLRETLQEQELQHNATAQSLLRLRAQLAQPEWTARVEPAQILAVQLEARLWQAPTAGLAQAAFLDWLNAAMVKAGVTRPQITVTVIDEITSDMANQTPVHGTTPADLWKIRAKLGFGFSQETMLGFLQRIENHEKQIIVETLNARTAPFSHVEMELVGYFQKQTPPATANNEQKPL